MTTGPGINTALRDIAGHLRRFSPGYTDPGALTNLAALIEAIADRLADTFASPAAPTRETRYVSSETTCEVKEPITEWPFVRRCRNPVAHGGVAVDTGSAVPERLDICANHYLVAEREGALVGGGRADR